MGRLLPEKVPLGLLPVTPVPLGGLAVPLAGLSDGAMFDFLLPLNFCDRREKTLGGFPLLLVAESGGSLLVL